MTRSARTSNVVSLTRSRTVAPISRSPSSSGASARTRVAATAPPADRGPEHGEREPGVVLDPVVIDDPAGQALAPQVRRVLDRARRPEVLREAAVATRAEQVVQEDAAAVEALVEQRDAVDREQERLEASRDAARAGAAGRAPGAPRRRARSGAAPGSAGRRGSAASSGRTCPRRCRAARRGRPAARGSWRPAARPTPTIPPPTMRTSKRSSARASRASARHGGSATLAPVTAGRSGFRRPARGDPPQDEAGADDEDARSGAACGTRRAARRSEARR